MQFRKVMTVVYYYYYYHHQGPWAATRFETAFPRT
jgi:hypothetical protein